MVDVSAALLVIGAAFLLLAAVGIIRMPDLFMRMQAATKASTLGVGFMILAAGIYFDDLTISIRVLLVTAFLFLTAPVAAHVIARSAYFVGAPLWEHTVIDELRGHYDRRTHELHTEDEVRQITGEQAQVALTSDADDDSPLV